MNNNFMRPGQGNRNRNRNNRNRHRSGGSGGGGGGGNSSNKVFDSNGPDVKLRGTAQTVAEKYMQLGRDAQSSGDNVAAESYYQHAEHYYRIWASNQPQGASLIMSKKLGEEEFEEEGATQDDGAEDEGAEGQAAEAQGEGAEGAEAAGDPNQPQGDGQQRQFNNNRNNNRDNRDGGRERFRPRWQRNRERYQQDGNPESPANVAGAEPHAPVAEAEQAGGQWEAPSFLQRPTPAPAPAEAEAAVQAEAPRRPRTRRPREDQAAPVAADDNAPQGE